MNRTGKLTLELEELAVESFDTTTTAGDRDGTVFAHAPNTDPFVCKTPDCNTDENRSCSPSVCGMCVTLYDPTCPGYALTCYPCIEGIE